jgi:molybdenum cofactor biosynthesis protein A
MIKDTHGRIIDYVRLAVTDRCNLRCTYCLPEGFTNFLPRKELLTYEEIIRMLTVMSDMGIKKLRITGGEPFVRNDLMGLIEEIHSRKLFEKLHITTNGVLTAPHIPRLAELGISGINISLDTANAEHFKAITGRDNFSEVMETFHAALSHNIPTRINTVVLSDKNTDDIIPMARMAENHPIEVRFIEEMPFNGKGEINSNYWNYERILLHLSQEFDLHPEGFENNGTAMRYRIAGKAGKIGIIPAYSRTFCGTCNRLRINPKGEIATCLYSAPESSLFTFLRGNATDVELREAILSAVSRKPLNGHQAEEQMLLSNKSHNTMAAIGG